MGIERQNIQMRLAFPEGDWGEAPGGSREGTEMPVAVCAPESPAEETAQPAEPPCTDPYARWCDRESLRRPTYVDFTNGRPDTMSMIFDMIKLTESYMAGQEVHDAYQG